MNVKTSDLGWFYHAPPRPKECDRVIPPPPSQIPGLSDVSHLPEPPQPRMWIKESDSKYIQLAKMGGRQDLLSYNPPDTHSEEPVGYPRVDWYYDNLTPPKPADECESEPYQFMLPDYMVFQPNGPKKNNRNQNSNSGATGSFSNDNSTVFQREGGKATDKTQKLPEERPPGYGVRAEKQQQKDAKAGKAKSFVFSCDAAPKPPPSNFAKEVEREGADMKKLMSYGYACDYDMQRKQYERQTQLRDEQKQLHRTDEPHKTHNTATKTKKK